MSRIKKFNGGAGAILCNDCSVIVKQGMTGCATAEEYHKKHGTYPDGLITDKDWKSNEPLYCAKCQAKRDKKIITSTPTGQNNFEEERDGKP